MLWNWARARCFQQADIDRWTTTEMSKFATSHIGQKRLLHINIFYNISSCIFPSHIWLLWPQTKLTHQTDLRSWHSHTAKSPVAILCWSQTVESVWVGCAVGTSDAMSTAHVIRMAHTEYGRVGHSLTVVWTRLLTVSFETLHKHPLEYELKFCRYGDGSIIKQSKLSQTEESNT